MKFNIKLLIFVLILMHISLSVTITSVEANKQSYMPGDQGNLNVVIDTAYTNSNGESAIALKLSTLEVSSSLFHETFNLGYLKEGITTVNVPFYIKNDAKEGMYTITLKISGTALIKKGEKVKEEHVESFSVTSIAVVKKPIVGLNVLEKTISKEGVLPLKVCVQSTSIRDITISSSTSSFFIEDPAYIEKINEGECIEKNINYDASLLKEGKNIIVLKAEYYDKVGDKYEKEFGIPITLSLDDTRFSVVFENSLPYKHSSTLKLIIKNKQNDIIANNVRLYISNLTVLGDEEINIGTLNPGESKEAIINAYVNKVPSIYKIPITIKWKENGEEKTTTISSSLIVIDNKNDVNVYIEASQVPLHINEDSTISISVGNKADYSLYGVSVEIEGKGFELLDIENKKFIGSLEGNDFSSVQFKIKPLSKDIILNISVKYKDPSGKQITKTFNKHVIAITPKKKADNSLVIVIGIIAIIIAVYFFKFRKKK